MKVQRSPEEVVDIFKTNVSMLKLLCKHFDNGSTKLALWIAVVLRTLLHTNEPDTISIMDQLIALDAKYNIKYLSTSFPKPTSGGFLQGWDISNISNTSITSVSVYAGLLIKELKGCGNGGYEVDACPMADRYSDKNHSLTLDSWLEETIFEDMTTGFSLTRWGAIYMVANKDGGAHFDSKIPQKYDTFRQKDLFKLRCNDKEVSFTRNPVYVSIRQIAWEVIVSMSNACII